MSSFYTQTTDHTFHLHLTEWRFLLMSPRWIHSGYWAVYQWWWDTTACPRLWLYIWTIHYLTETVGQSYLEARQGTLLYKQYTGYRQPDRLGDRQTRTDWETDRLIYIHRQTLTEKETDGHTELVPWCSYIYKWANNTEQLADDGRTDWLTHWLRETTDK